MSSTTRQLKIQTGVVKRLTREVEVYKQEMVTQQARIDAFIQQGKDEHDVRKQQEVLQETEMMIPDTEKRLAAARADLESTLSLTLSKDAGLESSEEVQAAKAVLAL